MAISITVPKVSAPRPSTLVEDPEGGKVSSEEAPVDPVGGIVALSSSSLTLILYL